VAEERRIEKLSVPDAVAVAVRLHQAGHLGEAEELYRNVLAAVPEHPDALHFLGVLCHQRGRTAEGIQLVTRALAVTPDHVDAQSNLGNLLRDAGRLAEAEAAYRRAIALVPTRTAPRNNLGVVLKNQGRLAEAVAEYRAALAIDPSYADAHHNLAAALTAQGKHDEAVVAARRAIELRPDHAHAWRNLSHALHRGGNDAEATRVLEQWLALDPDNAVAAHMLAALGARSAPARAADAYVTEVFDDFAGSFDAVMRGLEYRAPGLLAERLASDIPVAAADLDVLDAGCGTGLCAPILRPFARRLIGVDLSPGMIARARARDAYDELVVGELTAFLASRKGSFDVIASADTLVYVGDLGPFFVAAADALRPGGLLVFTVEHAADAAEPFRLDPTGRYSHTRDGIASGLADGGLTLAAMTEAVLREEQGRPVAGLVVSARNGSPSVSLSDAIGLHRAGRLAEAERLYRRLLRHTPDDPDVLHFFGVLLHRTRRSAQAVDLIERAIARAPEHADAHNNLGNVFTEQGRFEEALVAYRRAIALRPDFADAYNNLGTVLRAQNRLDDALAAYEDAIARDPRHAEAYVNRGNVLKERGDFDGAIDAYLQAIAHARFPGDAYRNLGNTLYAVSRIPEALAVYETWLRYEPDHPVALHMRAACSGHDAPARASDGYIRDYFGRFAESFDTKLEALEYRAPELVVGAITDGLPAGAAYDVLDPGCGTGLCGPLLRPWARQLVGVDLSAGMLEKARARGTYDALVVAELTEHMSGAIKRYDLIVCVDTLCYFGGLLPAFRAAATALRPGGRFACSLEHDEDAPDFRLNPNGRYTHTEAYVRRTLVEAGLTLRSLTRETLRTEGQKPVAGLVIVATG